jgi:hypothetical protein
MDVLSSRPAQVVDGRLVADLPPHILRLARMIARDCAAPGQYVIHLTIPDRPRAPATIQTARVDVIRDAVAERK